MMSRKMTVSACIGTLLVSGCAHELQQPASVEKIQEKTAWALGLEAGDFTISNVQRESLETRYNVRTKSGKEYRCYVTSLSGISALMAGSAVMSDAVCAKKGSPAGNPLSEAAGRSH